jgi:hypothetical protein
MVAAGGLLIVAVVVNEYALQPPAGATVYVTVYVPDVLNDGVISPVVLLILKPVGALNVPPVVPVTVTPCTVVTVLQYGDPV